VAVLMRDGSSAQRTSMGHSSLWCLDVERGAAVSVEAYHGTDRVRRVQFSQVQFPGAGARAALALRHRSMSGGYPAWAQVFALRIMSAAPPRAAHITFFVFISVPRPRATPLRARELPRAPSVPASPDPIDVRKNSLFMTRVAARRHARDRRA